MNITKEYMKSVSKEIFELETSLLLDVICETIIANFEKAYKQTLTKEQKEWFVNHANVRIRWFYANDTKWHQKLKSQSNTGKDWCYMFITHWLTAFMINEEQYKERHGIYDE